MKARTLMLFAVASSIVWTTADENKGFADQKEQTSYAIGQYTGSHWKRQGLETGDINIDRFIEGFRDVILDGNPRLDEQEMNVALRALNTELRGRFEEKRRVFGEKNKAEGEAFLAQNKTKPGVKTTPSGLQYKVISEGAGPNPTPTDNVTVHYRGTLIDGTEFDSSYKREKPQTFRASGVIPGWTEALQMMNPGAKWQLVIPPDLAYGERGGGATIGPNAVLVFDVELLSIQKAEAPAQATQQPVTSDIIKVPSAEELARGAKIEIIKADQIEKEKAREQQKK
jgi:FKBP-type peptidyl-prolyl cis-trans isomerase FklB